MSLEIKQGNIFASEAHTITIPVDCDGEMGSGLALECRLRYPQLYYESTEICKEEESAPNRFWTLLDFDYRVVCFPIKNVGSIEMSIRKALESFVSSYKGMYLPPIAFPLLGVEDGLSQQESLSIMEEYLSGLGIPVYIYKDIAGECDVNIEWGDFFTQFIEFILTVDSSIPFKSVSPEQLQGIKKELWKKDVFLVQHLLNVEGINLNTLENFCREVDSYLMVHRW